MNSTDSDAPLRHTSSQILRFIKRAGFTISGLSLAGIVMLMVLASGKNEDLTGIVAPALLLALLSGGAGVAAACLDKRPPHGS